MEDIRVISLCDPVLGEAEKSALESVIDSQWLTMGDRVSAFEKAFAKLHDVEDAVAVNSCTAGLHLCLAATGIGPGDEVLVPSLTFVATVNAVLYVGATPVFVDIEDPEVPHISLADAETKCTERTRAAIVMHYGGCPVDMPAWRAFADRKGLILIEDAAHAPGLGAVGQWSDATAFSFYANKNMTTAEGGMVFARDGEILERMRRMRSHGMTTGTLDRYKGHAYSYDVTDLGYNYRMDELRAAIGLVQLIRLNGATARRRDLSQLYLDQLEERVPQVKVVFGGRLDTAAHLMAVLLPPEADRPFVMLAMRQVGIQTSIHYPPVHCFSYYRQRFPGVTLPNTEQYHARTLTLPLHPSLSAGDLHRIVGTLSDALSIPEGQGAKR